MWLTVVITGVGLNVAAVFVIPSKDKKLFMCSRLQSSNI